MTEVREVPVSTVNVICINLMLDGGRYEATETQAQNVADLRKSREEGGLDLTGTIIVDNVVADATTPLVSMTKNDDGTWDTTTGSRVSHVQGGKRGGN